MKTTTLMSVATLALLARVWLWAGAGADWGTFAFGASFGATLAYWVVRLCLRP